MKAVRDVKLAHYRTSKDYRLLWSLARRESLVCFLDERVGEEEVFQRVATTLYLPRNSAVEVGARGILHFGSQDQDSFVDSCEKANLRFILPNTSPVLPRVHVCVISDAEAPRHFGVFDGFEILDWKVLDSVRAVLSSGALDGSVKQGDPLLPETVSELLR